MIFKSKTFKNGKIQVAYYVNDRCMGNLYFNDLNQPCIYILYLNIHPKYQNKGIGTKLMHEVLKYKKNCSLHVAINNTGAIEFYKKLGFFITLALQKKQHYLMSKEYKT